MNPFSYETLEDLANACLCYHHDTLKKAADNPEVNQRRGQLARWIQKFHMDCGAVNTKVEEALDNLRSGPCLFLMTAHQPNLFAYCGVLRKATLNEVLAERLSRELKLPVVSFFGLADQDFTDDRWVKSALLPDVERRDGVFEIRVDLPRKLLLNRAARPSRQVLDRWRPSINDWLDRNLRLVNRSINSSDRVLRLEKSTLVKNFDELWSVVEEAFSRAKVYSDFNAFVISGIVNKVWGYGTLFARFSECQQIFEPEFCKLIAHYEEYSEYLKEATLSGEDSRGGVHELEYETIPFWFHCDCGSKARLLTEQQGAGLTGHGTCLRCGKEYQLRFPSKAKPDISEILAKISARSLSMPLVFFEGLRVLCYVGGTAGEQYLKQAKHVAERMGMLFPPVAVWRPKDTYSGIGQLAALSVFRYLSGDLDFSKYQAVKAQLENKIISVRREIETLELRKERLAKEVEINREEKVNEIKNLSNKQDQIRRNSSYSLLSRNLGLLENIEAVRKLHPCIVDYAVNIGLKETSDQWISYLKEDGNLRSDVSLKTMSEMTPGTQLTSM